MNKTLQLSLQICYQKAEYLTTNNIEVYETLTDCFKFSSYEEAQKFIEEYERPSKHYRDFKFYIHKYWEMY